MALTATTTEIPKKPAQRAAWVKYQLSIRGLSLASLARDQEVTRQAMAKTLYQPNARLERVIADALGVPQQVLFQDRYADNGRRLHLVFTAHRINPQVERNPKRAGAA